EEEWNTLRLLAVQEIQLLISQVTQNEHCTARDLDGKDVEGCTVDVNHWSGGKLVALQEELERLLAQLSDADCPLTTEQLRETLRAGIPDLQERVVAAVHEARLAYLSADQRYVIADILACSLQQQGFSLYGEDCFYEENDPHNAV